MLITLGFPIQAQQIQNSSEHLSFKGVPIDGTLSQYVAKMKKAGFVLTGTDKGIAMMKGEFAGYKDCMIGISTLQQQDLVNKIVVVFSERNDWSSLSNNYFSLKNLLTEKYGTPEYSIEKFQSYEPKSDGAKMTSVQLGECEYNSVFDTDKGSIELSIKNNSVTSCYVALAYFDRINSDVMKSTALDDL